jgi:hypothetical protein
MGYGLVWRQKMSKEIDDKTQVKENQSKETQIIDERTKNEYRWEFLRLNQQYQKDYVELLDDRINIEDEQLKNQNEIDFCQHWGISSLVNPALPKLPKDVTFAVEETFPPVLYSENFDSFCLDPKEALNVIRTEIAKRNNHLELSTSPYRVVVIDVRTCKPNNIKIAKYGQEFYASQKTLDLSNGYEEQTEQPLIIPWDIDDKYRKKAELPQRERLDILDRRLAHYERYLELQKEGYIENGKKKYYSDSEIYTIIVNQINNDNENNGDIDGDIDRSLLIEDIKKTKLLIENAPFIL